MSLIPWRNKTKEGNGSHELAPVSALRSEVDRLFDNFFREPFGALSRPGVWGETSLGWPAVDVAESENEVTVRAELPGVDPKEIDVSVLGTELVISGEKKETTEKTEKDLYYQESRYGSFRRSIPLPEGVDTEQVDADYSGGVLTVKLQKSPSSRPKKISVKNLEPRASTKNSKSS